MADNVSEWINGVPEGFSVTPLKHVVKKLKRPVAPSDEVLICSNKGLVVPRGENNPGLISLTDDGYQGVRPGDLLIHGMDTWHGAIAVSQLPGKCTSVVHVCDSTQDKRYLAYYLRVLAYRSVYKAFSNGVRQNTSDFRSWLKAGEIPVALPTRNEQQRIADYLDDKCAEIDRAIEAAEKSIDEYKAYEKALIAKAVTKGLSDCAILRESKIDWLGCVPSHWDIRYPKALFKARKERARQDDTMLTASQHHGMIPQQEFIKAEAYTPVAVETGHDILKHVEPNDFVIHMRSFQGGLELSRYQGKMSSAYIALYSCSEDVYHPYYRWVFKCQPYIDGLSSTTNLVRDGQAMRYANFIQLWLPVPSQKEQREIAVFLDTMHYEILKTVSTKQSIIEDLKAYKQSLVYETVTGKREV